MTTTLIVLAHPDQRSFNGAWAEATEKSSRELGHTVLWSDLTAMEFDPVESARHYPHFQTESAFDPLKAQEEAAKADEIPSDVATEIEKVRRADRVIFHFPLWWFAPPAVLKGWFDRVFAHGALHSVNRRFDVGCCIGKKALFCVTTGSSEAESAPNGKEGDVQMLLWPTAYTLRYLGYTVLVPEIVHRVHGYHRGSARKELQDRLQAVLETQPSLVSAFDERPALEFNLDSEFDDNGRLKPGSQSHSFFIRQLP
ncbi:MAG: NAD(P)H-dependent oxidoreductase [Boseongicola sp.]